MIPDILVQIWEVLQTILDPPGRLYKHSVGRGEHSHRLDFRIQ